MIWKLNQVFLGGGVGIFHSCFVYSRNHIISYFSLMSVAIDDHCLEPIFHYWFANWQYFIILYLVVGLVLKRDFRHLFAYPEGQVERGLDNFAFPPVFRKWVGSLASSVVTRHLIKICILLQTHGYKPTWLV